MLVRVVVDLLVFRVEIMELVDLRMIKLVVRSSVPLCIVPQVRPTVMEAVGLLVGLVQLFKEPIIGLDLVGSQTNREKHPKAIEVEKMVTIMVPHVILSTKNVVVNLRVTFIPIGNVEG